MTQTKTHRRSAGFAFTGLAGGIVASLAGNLQAINLGGQQPGIGAYVSAVIWPLALFVAIEIMLHTPWLATWRDGLTRWAGLLGVAGLAAWVSYQHLSHVLTAYGYDWGTAHFGPLAVDGLMAMASLALNRVGQARSAGTPRGQYLHITTAAPVAQDVPDMLTGAGDVMAAEAESYLDRLARDLPEAPSTPAVPVNPGSEMARRSSTPRGKVDEAEVAQMIQAAEDSGALKAREVNELLAAHYEVSARTIRRIRARLNGQPTSSAPAGAEDLT